MKESKTVYSYLIEHMESPSFKKVRDLACDFVRKLPQELCDELHNSLNKGVDILDTEALLQMYFYSFGDMHAAKLNYAFEHLQQYIKNAKKVELVDYGCGQGMASMCYHDFITNVNSSQEISKVILIEPSELALARANLLCSQFYPNAEIITVNKDFEDLTENDFTLSDSIPTIHLFSNILDVESYNLEKFAQLIKSKSAGDNEYVIVSPIQNANRTKRLKDFVSILNTNLYFEQYLDKRKFREDKDWTCVVLMCSSKKGEKKIQLNSDDAYETTATIEELNLSASAEELLEAWTDEFGVKYSKDHKKLLSIPSTFIHDEYEIKEGTEIICDEAFFQYRPNGFLQIYHITLPNSVKYIGNKAFCRSYLKTIRLSNNLLYIGDYAFSGCCTIKSFELPSSIKYIGQGCFGNCAFSRFVIPESVEYIKGNPWSGNFTSGKFIVENHSPFYTIRNGHLYSKDLKTIVCCLDDKEFGASTLENVFHIAGSAFSNCYIEALNIPETVISIGDYAFYESFGFEEVQLPDSLKSIGEYAFYLTQIKRIEIPDSVERIGSHAFGSCSQLASISLSNSLTMISDSMLASSSVYEIIIPPKVEQINNSAFCACSKLYRVTMNERLIDIGDNAFTGCFNLNELIIPSSVTHIGEAPFPRGHCQIRCLSNSYTIKNGMLFTADMKLLISCLYSSGEVEIPKGVEVIGRSAFDIGITSIIIPNSVKTICRYAFSGTSIKTITIPRSVTRIERFAITDCNELEEIRILNKNIDIDSEGFADGCESLKVILIPQGSYSYFFDLFEKWRLKDILVEGTKKSIFNDVDRISINEALHKNTMFRHPIIEK